MLTPIKQKLLEELDALPDHVQYRVLDFVRALALSLPRGVPGTQLLQFAGTIPIDDLHLMSKAIQASCERIDHEW